MRAILAGQSSAAWVGYAVPMVAGEHQMCCWNNNVMCGCSLEDRAHFQGVNISSNQTVKLEGPRDLVVLFRMESHQIGKIRTFTPDCGLDAGGLPSSQRESFGLLTQPCAVSSQTSSVQSTASVGAQDTGKPLAQKPPLQVSVPVQNSPSSQSASAVQGFGVATPITVTSST